MKRLILIRHGETNYSLQRKYCGHENIPLNSKGIEQANRLRLKLRNTKVDRIYSSDLRRAFQTAKIIFKDRIIFKRRGLREINFGQLHGLTFKEANRLYPDVYKTWLNNPTDVKMPDGESLRYLADRVNRCFRSIFNQNIGKIVAIISHGGPIRIILLNLLGFPLDKFWDIEQDIAAFNVINSPKQNFVKGC